MGQMAGQSTGLRASALAPGPPEIVFPAKQLDNNSSPRTQAFAQAARQAFGRPGCSWAAGSKWLKVILGQPLGRKFGGEGEFCVCIIEERGAGKGNN